MAGESSGEERSLEYTPTWSVAIVCSLFVIVSFVGERSLHHLGHWLTKTKRKPLYEALEKMKEELMLLGFLSLLITVLSSPISEICVNTAYYNKHFMPCNIDEKKPKEAKNFLLQRRLLEYFMEQTLTPRRELASYGATKCPKDEEPFITYKGLVQLHKFLFILGCTHVFYSCLTMLLAMMKIYRWRRWEDEAHQVCETQQNMAEMCRNLTMKRQSTFVAYHTSTPGSKNRIFVWVICFFRQFGHAVTKSDYLALRLGFVTKHATGAKYDFHSYMLRCMEEEFKHIVGISPLFWLFVVVFMLFNIDGTNFYFYASFLPVLLVMLVGAKLQRIIAQLALENSGLSGPLTGVHLRPRDSLFWFKKPRLMLHLIHFTLFQDAFELATFFWVWWQFGWDSCLMSKKPLVFTRVISGILVQLLCSYSTLPLYALVTQMGSYYKKTIFQDNVIESLHQWKKNAKHRVREASTHPAVHAHPQDQAVDEDEEDSDDELHFEQAGNRRGLAPSAPTAAAEIELGSEPVSRHSSTSGGHGIMKVEKVANPFMTPVDTLLSPRMPEYHHSYHPSDASSTYTHQSSRK